MPVFVVLFSKIIKEWLLSQYVIFLVFQEFYSLLLSIVHFIISFHCSFSVVLTGCLTRPSSSNCSPVKISLDLFVLLLCVAKRDTRFLSISFLRYYFCSGLFDCPFSRFDILLICNISSHSDIHPSHLLHLKTHFLQFSLIRSHYFLKYIDVCISTSPIYTTSTIIRRSRTFLNILEHSRNCSENPLKN